LHAGEAPELLRAYKDSTLMNIVTPAIASPTDADHNLAFLSGVPLFQELPPHDLKFLTRLLDHAVYPAGTVIFEQGAITSDLLIIEQGMVSVFLKKIDGTPLELTRLGPGSYFGEMAVFDDYPRSSSAKALSDVRVCRIGRDAFRAFVGFHPAVLFQMCKVFSHRIRNTNSQLARH
jgi:CRP-like cAMP-binding protein